MGFSCVPLHCRDGARIAEDHRRTPLLQDGRASVPSGVAVGVDGTIYFSADRNNALYRVRARR
jgi:glucose/arabinose dehydrogenase